ncbi:endo-1,3-alpha-glucanase family glycosylhydrolase [Novosphingobium album (ex Liu et al. 2023)]|uniref:Endo-1,3-alpha-glucanase family glycosylhydrolase n=1 Tax=Novosphingobium album (ex Liu et al. 2023) TaxID=3031130 RepID=A0ABT5WKA6_9SPHN|nr:endo-1,3-alpha-glucanase family glycosylhydrolase [Novosphingobium album (ex Liu et al. 2023)]MDE8650482.1 endo-1,3-alpha-glucanase family glycosylhydrolase [Novosphingobium album (ex Liu et al. 2023)]
MTLQRIGLVALAATAVVSAAYAAHNAREQPSVARRTALRMPTLSGQASGPASTFVRRESPDEAFAFRTATPGSQARPVIAHYFPPFPITIGGRGPGRDYYEVHYLKPEGENGKFARGGGFLRERPLPGPPAKEQSKADFRIEVARAARIGIDAFGVDLLQLGGKSGGTVRGLLDAAATTDPRFRIAIEPDMMALKTATLEELVAYLTRLAKHPAAMRTADGRLVIMPFAADARDAAFWTGFAQAMAKAGEPIALIPDFVDSRSSAALAGISAAGATWGSRAKSAGDGQRGFAASVLRQGYPAWVATAAPQDMRPKSLVAQEAQGSLSFAGSLRAAIDGGAAALHLVTWNDYSEGSELAPSSATRFGYYDLAAYYIAWFKQGAPPAIRRDGFVGLHRRQLFRPADTSRGAAWQVRGDRSVDLVEMTAFLTAPAELVITTGGNTYRQAVSGGLQRVTAPAGAGPVKMAIERGGRTITACNSPWTIEAAPDRHDPLYAGFSSLRGCH